MRGEPTTLFCWSGGGLPGLDIHAGIWMALDELGIRSTANAGTSAGAIMAALNSTGIDGAVAGAIVTGLKDSDVRSERFAWKVRIPWISYFLENKPVRDLLAWHLPSTFEKLAKPLQVFATHDQTGESMAFFGGELIGCVLASMAISGVFPSVGGCSDGGTTADLPLPEQWENYDRVYLLVAKRPLEYGGSDSMLSRLMYNADLFMENQVRRTIAEARAKRPDVVVIRPPVRTVTGGLHFDHALVGEAHRFTKMILAGITPKTEAK